MWNLLQLKVGKQLFVVSNVHSSYNNYYFNSKICYVSAFYGTYFRFCLIGQFHKNCCPKGRACNFLHVFRNPGNAFYAADRDHQDWRRKQQRERTRGQTPSPQRSRDRSWSGSPQNSHR